jgi:hypothetical protein
MDFLWSYLDDAKQEKQKIPFFNQPNNSADSAFTKA